MGAVPVAGRPAVGRLLRRLSASGAAMTGARDERLRAELLRRARTPTAPGNADRLWDVLDEYERWPGYHLVDVDGEHAAWLIAQLGDLDLQRRCLDHLEVAVDQRDAPPAHLACLQDRVDMADGRPQRYGSQWIVGADGRLEPWPIADADTVEVRRARVGLAPLAVQRLVVEAQYAERGRPEWPTVSDPPPP